MLMSFAYIADKHTPGMALDGGVPIQSPTLKGHLSRIRTVLNCLNATKMNIFVGNDVGWLWAPDGGVPMQNPIWKQWFPK